jgi:RNA polymerase II subunit A C-terminal domain phosphatase
MKLPSGVLTPIRPGWHDFLHGLSEKYEMHVYTMGTRAYAEEVCKAIDPEGKIFGNRILSRDESGSQSRSSLPSYQTLIFLLRSDTEEPAKVIPLRYVYGGHYR